MTLVAQGSPPALLPAGATVGEASAGTFKVGSCTGVSVGKGVLVGAAVGGGTVAVGIAACVCATMVEAAATAVFCISTGLGVGAGLAPQALMIIAMATITVKVEKCFMVCKCLLVNLAVWIAAA